MLNLDISLNCDWQTTNTAKSQIGFINFLVLPLFKVVETILPESKECIDNLNENKEYWSSKIEYYDQELQELVKWS